MLTENGMGVEDEERFRKDGFIQDDYRIDFVASFAPAPPCRAQDEANCTGYLMDVYQVLGLGSIAIKTVMA